MLEKEIEKIYECIVRPSLLSLAGNDPEKLHNVFLWLLHQAGKREKLAETIERILTFKDLRLRQKIRGLNYSNPVGFAAGFDKNGAGVGGIASLGIGFHEIGTVTPLPQLGFKPPRIWYCPEEKALINKMGFPNDGADIIAGRLEKAGPISVPVIVSIGKGINTRVENAACDYMHCLQRFYSCGNVSSFSVNVSCPHMPRLCELRSEEYFCDLISTLKDSLKNILSRSYYNKVIVSLTFFRDKLRLFVLF